MSKILVTGGAGYIGSHAVLALKQAGYDVVILDNLDYGHRELVDRVLETELVIGDTRDRATLDRIFSTHNIDAVMHFAAYIAVGESVEKPDLYYQNNVVGTLTLLEAMLAAGIKKFVFSSTCAVYGVPQFTPLTEAHPFAPISPYASSKLMVENILSDLDRAYGLKSVRFRYFWCRSSRSIGRRSLSRNPSDSANFINRTG
jgi:UDP-glucose 4-epimerase